MNIKDKAFALLMQAFSSRIGGVAQYSAGVIVGALVYWLLQAGIELDEDTKGKLLVGLSATFSAVIASAMQAYQHKQAAKLQKALDVLPDGWIGPVTIKRAEVVNAAEGVAP